MASHTDTPARIELDKRLYESNTENLQLNEEKYSKTIIQNTSKQDACGYISGDGIKILWCSDSHGGHIDKKKLNIFS